MNPRTFPPMFEFFFKYPIPVFLKGKYILLGAWPGWMLALSIVLAAGGLGWLVWRALPHPSEQSSLGTPVKTTGSLNFRGVTGWRVWAIWGTEAALVALLLTLLWEPAITVAELKSQQNIIAVLLDDSRSMAIADAGADAKTPREAVVLKTLEDGVLDGLKKKFQVREYRLDGGLTREEGTPPFRDEAAKGWATRESAAATHINAGLRQLLNETSDLPLGAVVLLSDGAENGAGGAGGGIDADTINALHNRRLPVHTIGFGKEKPLHDLELDDAAVAVKAMAGAKVTVTVSFHQHGYTGQKATLDIKDGDKLLTTR
ncbi:MAG TPA: hypothetical protein VII58_11470, partial [Acidobacteriaceae bacterium]